MTELNVWETLKSKMAYKTSDFSQTALYAKGLILKQN